MRVSLGFVLCLFLVHAIAGGIRGLYERMFIWYAYQAEIDYVKQKYGKVDITMLKICASEAGTGSDKTLTFNEFIEYTNRPRGQTTKGMIPSIVQNGHTPLIDATVQNMWKNRRKPGWWHPRWQWPGNMIATAGNSYDKMMTEISRNLYQSRQALNPSNANVGAAIDAIQKVVISRRIDYEKFRLPEMKRAPEFTGEKKVYFAEWELVLPQESRAREIDWETTLRDARNKGQKDIEQRVAQRERNVYLKDPTPITIDSKPTTVGANRSTHKRALDFVMSAESIAKTGRC